MSLLLADNITSISELKKNPSAIRGLQEVCVLSHNKPAYYCLSPERFDWLLKIESFYMDKLEKGLFKLEDLK